MFLKPKGVLLAMKKTSGQNCLFALYYKLGTTTYFLHLYFLHIHFPHPNKPSRSGHLDFVCKMFFKYHKKSSGEEILYSRHSHIAVEA